MGRCVCVGGGGGGGQWVDDMRSVSAAVLRVCFASQNGQPNSKFACAPATAGCEPFQKVQYSSSPTEPPGQDGRGGGGGVPRT